MLKLDKKTSMSLGIYYIGYVSIKLILEILYLLINRIDGFVEEKEGDKYLNIASTNTNTEVLKNMQKFGIKLKIVQER